MAPLLFNFVKSLKRKTISAEEPNVLLRFMQNIRMIHNLNQRMVKNMYFKSAKYNFYVYTHDNFYAEFNQFILS